MTDEIEFETYIRISSKIIGIYVFDKTKLQNLHFDEINYEIEKDSNNFQILTKLIEENILRIEKLIGKFINNISLIIENKKILNLNFCLKKKIMKKKLVYHILRIWLQKQRICLKKIINNKKLCIL